MDNLDEILSEEEGKLNKFESLEDPTNEENEFEGNKENQEEKNLEEVNPTEVPFINEDLPQPPLLPSNPFEESSLSLELKELIDIIFNPNIYNEQLEKEELDLQKKTILNYSGEDINKGFDILNDIFENLRKKKAEAQYYLEASMKFYQIFPHKFKNKRILIINSESVAFAKVELLLTILNIQNSLNLNEEERKLKIMAEKQRREKEKKDFEEMELKKKKARIPSIATKAVKKEAELSSEQNPDGEIEENKEEDIIILEEIQNCYDRNYKNLHCKIENLSLSCEESTILKNYIEGTLNEIKNFYDCQILNIYSLSCENEPTFEQPDINCYMLMYGCKISNLVDIIRYGLKIPPNKAPKLAYKLGKGIYFSDAASKSINFCYPSSNDSIGFLILSEVDLGITNEKITFDFETLNTEKNSNSNENIKFRSVKGLGRITHKNILEIDFDEIFNKKCAINENDLESLVADQKENDITKKYLVRVPDGELVSSEVKNSEFLYDEYVVYNEKQIKLKYLIKLRFHSKS